MAKRLRNSSIGTWGDPAPSTQDIVHTPKYTELDGEAEAEHTRALQCLLPPHKSLTFSSYPEYEKHYNQSHTNRCRACQKNFPSNHFLEVHLSENHDPIVASRRDRGDKTFACFVEGCDKVCSDWKKRRSHLVDKHGFPKNYDFFIVNNGIDGRRSMLRPGIDAQGHRKSSRERRDSSATEVTQTTEATSVSQDPGDVVEEEDRSETMTSSARLRTARKRNSDAAVDEVTRSMSSLQFVPRSITFGKKGKAGFAKS